MTRGKGKNEEDECIDQVQSEVQRGRVPTYIVGGASPINDRDVYVRKWEVISNTTPPSYSGSTPSSCIVEQMVGKTRISKPQKLKLAHIFSDKAK